MATPAELFDLTDRVAVVTGGSRGLGRAMVLGLAEAGADVVVASRKLDNCEAVAAEVEAMTGRKALAVACHVAYWDQCDHLVETVYDRFGRVDVFINNAGMSPLYPDLNAITEDYYDKVNAVNLKGPFRLAVSVGTRMRERGSGSIINVSTMGSLRPNPGDLVYACAKAGLNAMTVGLAQAFAPKVRVNCLMPGAFHTDVVAHWTEEARSGKSSLWGRIGKPEEIVGGAIFLASDASSYMSGGFVRIDGGGLGGVF
ncbi:MAG TPA: glucose 1-dehydrogenase [Acidimicrobiales bacterium]|nr:glucose 1-dehydrogenase [Acidimicrobiales bacterium]